MKTGIELIKEERCEQIDKHGFNSEHDARSFNENGELLQAAGYLMGETCKPKSPGDIFWVDYPQPWNLDRKEKFRKKSKIEKLIIAGALIAAEIDRLGNELQFCPECFSQEGVNNRKYLDPCCEDCGASWADAS